MSSLQDMKSGTGETFNSGGDLWLASKFQA